VAICGNKDGIVQVSDGSSQLLSESAKEWFKDEIDLEATGTQQECFAVEWQDEAQYILFFRSQDNPWGRGCDKALVWHYLTGKFSYYRFLNAFLSGEVIKDDDGTDIIALGDIWGYVWQFPFADTDGAAEGATVTGTVTAYEEGVGSPGICVLTDDNAVFPTFGLGLAGVPVYIPSINEWVIIASNTATELFLEECFDVAPAVGATYYLGPIEFWYKTGWMDFATIARVKYLDSAFLVHDRDEDSVLTFRVYKDMAAQAESLVDATTGDDAGSLSLDDVTHEQKIRIGGVQFKHVAIELYDFRPANPISVWDLSFKLRGQDPS
jgi:hypothetical protein